MNRTPLLSFNIKLFEEICVITKSEEAKIILYNTWSLCFYLSGQKIALKQHILSNI